MDPIEVIPDLEARVEGVDDLVIHLERCQVEQPCDQATYRPTEPPIANSGEAFQPFKVPDREPVIRDLPLSPLQLLLHFLPHDLVDRWVEITNEAPTPGPAGPASRRSRQLDWKPTRRSEVYVWLGILIYLGIHRESRLKDHWKTPAAGSEIPSQLPTHPIIKFMTFDRFELLLRRIRIFDPTAPSPSPDDLSPPARTSQTYRTIEEWSQHLQKASSSLYDPGSDVAVDEAIVPFLGRAKETVRIPNKPNPVGYKIWCLSQRGYTIRWLPHVPDAAFGPTTGGPVRNRKRKRQGSHTLNPTQSVVPYLVERLPHQTYHVFYDNLFSTASLAITLRDQGVGATGTCRTNSGIHKSLVEAKAADERGRCWGYNELKTIPTPDNKVRKEN
jgi:hypothetical protein